MPPILLASFPTCREAFAKYTQLVELFKKTHKRGEKVELYIGIHQDQYTLRAYYTKELESEAQWFLANS
jgi:hypothetical protein